MIRNYASAIAARAMSAGLSLASTSFVAHSLGREDLGIYLAVLGLGQIVSSAMLFGLDVTPAYIVRLYPEISARLYWVFCGLGLACAAACVALFIPASSVVGRVGGAVSVVPFIYAATTILMTVQMVLLQGFGRFFGSQVMQVVFPGVFLGAAFLCEQMFGGLTNERAVLLWALAGAVSALVGLFFALGSPMAHGVVATTPAPAPRIILGKAAAYGAAIYGGNLVSALNVRLPALLAPIVIGESYGGYFAGVLFLHDVFGFFSFAIVSITMSSLAGVTDLAHRSDVVARACRLNTLLTFGAVLAFLIGFFVFVPIILGTDFADYRFFAMIACMLPVTAFHSTIRILCSDFASQGRPAVNIWLNGVSIVVLCLLFPLAGRLLGEWGAVIAYVATTLTFSLAALFVYLKTSTLGPISYFVVQPSEIRGAISLGKSLLNPRNQS